MEEKKEKVLLVVDLTHGTRRHTGSLCSGRGRCEMRSFRLHTRGREAAEHCSDCLRSGPETLLIGGTQTREETRLVLQMLRDRRTLRRVLGSRAAVPKHAPRHAEGVTVRLTGQGESYF